MAVSPIIPYMQGIFTTPEYADRIPANVQSVITSGNYGQSDFPTDINNAIFNTLVDKIARQDIYQFQYNNFDASRFDKGYLPFGGIIEDDFVQAKKADNVKDLPSKANEGTYKLEDFDPFKISYGDVASSYYFLKFFLQYRVTTSLDMFKRAFINESSAVSFVQTFRSVLPSSGVLDKYLMFRNMLTSDTIYPAASTVAIPITGGNDGAITTEDSINLVRTIRTYVDALKWNMTKYNKAGVLTSTPKDKLVLFISQGIKTAIVSAQYNAFNRDLDFGAEVIELDGFGAPAATTGQFAVLADERALKLYYWLSDRMDNIWNPVSTGYWNTFYTFGMLMGYSMHANIIRFELTAAA